MTVSPLALLDPALHPRRGQKVILDFHGETIAGTIQAASRAAVDIRPDSLSLLRQLNPNAHLRARVMVPVGVCELVISHLTVLDGGLLRGQLIGHPVLVQRRSAPRVALELRAGLLWMDEVSSAWMQAEALTVNVSVGGLLLGFPRTPSPQPPQDVVALLGLSLPDGPTSFAVRVLQAWDEGARVRIVDAERGSRDRLRTAVALATARR